MIFGNQCCSAYPDCLHSEPDDGLIGACDHENTVATTEGKGEAWLCLDCGASGFSTYSDMYGVSDADFI